ncbi:hypothetical protein LEM8419_01002 [Neolewinella maritima]|uniref:TolC family protein n=1 Tax=Neolewinella maritima TaxID=1383882 RepID=A0ABM9AYW3_9BACT|nr:hypothetical protein [Neolewinella maritima]CAH0999702.1 hypothetical protein LEM8419_01002 [Neolewinella maritima]
MGRYVLLSVMLTGLCSAAGAQAIDVEQFFARGGVNLSAPAPQAGPRFRTPFIDSYDLRTETDENNYERQEYTLRLNFSSRGRARAQRAFYDQLLLEPLETLNEATCDRTEDLYRDWVRLYLLQRELEIVDSLQLVYQDRQRVADRYAAALRGDPNDRFKLRTDRTELLLDRQAILQRIAQLRAAYGLDDAPLDFTAFPTVDDLATRAEELAIAPRQDPETAYDLALIDREIALEEAEGRQLLDFLQLRYRSNRDSEFRENFSVGLALRIRDSGDSKLKIRQLQLEKELIEREGSLQTQVRQIAGTFSATALRGAIASYRATELILREEADDLSSLATTVASREDVDPRFLLRVNAQRLERQLDRLSAVERVLEAYLDWRDAREELCSYPGGELL